MRDFCCILQLRGGANSIIDLLTEVPRKVEFSEVRRSKRPTELGGKHHSSLEATIHSRAVLASVRPVRRCAVHPGERLLRGVLELRLYRTIPVPLGLVHP
jgi:hypothetical protein